MDGLGQGGSASRLEATRNDDRTGQPAPAGVAEAAYHAAATTRPATPVLARLASLDAVRYGQGPVLAPVSADTGLTPERRASRLCTLIYQIYDEPFDARAPLYDALLIATMQLDPALRLAPLTALAERIYQLPLEQRAAAFQSTAAAVVQMPAQDCAGPLRDIIVCIIDVPYPDREAALRQVLALVQALPSEFRAMPLEEIALRLDHLPPPARSAVFGDVLRAIADLPAEQRVEPLIQLGSRLGVLPRHERLEAFLALIDAGETLPLESRSPTFSEAFMAIRGMPAEAGDDAMGRAIDALSQLHGRDLGRPLRLLDEQIAALPATRQSQAQRRLARLRDG